MISLNNAFPAKGLPAEDLTAVWQAWQAWQAGWLVSYFRLLASSFFILFSRQRRAGFYLDSNFVPQRRFAFTEKTERFTELNFQILPLDSSAGSGT